MNTSQWTVNELRAASRFRLGRWQVDQGACRISDDVRSTKIEPRAMAVLVHLAANADRTVTREELLDEIWGTRHVVDEALTKCVSQLRQALVDNPRQPTFIETVPKIGYRLLIQPAVWVSPQAPQTSVAPTDLPDAVVATSEPRASAGPRLAWRRMAYAVAALIALAIVFVVGSMLHRSQGRAPSRPIAIALPESHGLVEFTAAPLALSADGRSLIVAMTDAEGSRLWHRQLDSGDLSPIAGTEGATSPFLSPDGQWIAFAAQGKIKRVSMDGGQAQVITDAEQFFGGCWLGPDTIVFAPRFARGLWRVSISGGSVTALTTPVDPNTAHIWPTCLPDGRTVLYSLWRGGSNVDQSAIGLVTNDGQNQGVLLEGAYFARYLREGYLLYASVGSLMAIKFDPQQRKISGTATTLFRNVLTNVNSQVAFFETSNSNHLALVQGKYEQPERRLMWVSRDGHATAASALRGPFSSPRIAADGRIAVWLQDDEVGVWVLDPRRDQLSRVSLSRDDHSPVWSPDGRQLAFDSSRSGQYRLYVANLDSPGTERVVSGARGDAFVNAWLRDGRLVYTRHAIESGADLHMVDPRRPEHEQPLLASPFSESEAAFSPDDRLLAYVSDESGRKEVYVRAFPLSGSRVQVSREGGEEPAWSRDGRELYFRSGRHMLAAQVRHDTELHVSQPAILFSGPYHYNLYSTVTYDVAADGRFLMVETPPPTQRTVTFAPSLGERLNREPQPD